MSDMTPSDFKALMGDDNGNGLYGGGAGVLILIILFLMRGGLYGNEGGANLNTDFAILERKMDGISNGICSAQYENAQQTYQLQSVISQGFAQQAQCCCETNRNIDAVRYENALAKGEIISAIQAEGEKNRAMLYQDKIDSLQQQLNAQGREMQSIQTKGWIDQATCGIVRYPQAIAYSAGQSPFFGGCGCNTGCVSY